MKAAFLIGPILFGGYFLYNGVNHFKQQHMLAQYAGSKKVPAPQAAVSATGLALIVGGSSMVFGIKPNLGRLR